MTDRVEFHAFEPAPDAFRRDVREGLRQRQKRIPAKYLYDARGCELFDQITTLPEYYLTRCEREILQRRSAEVAHLLGGGAVLIEYGCGNGSKARLLLDRVPGIAVYVPVDIAREQVRQTACHLSQAHPHLRVIAVWADVTRPLALPLPAAGRRALLFLGSTIGNFEPGEARTFLRHAVAPLRRGDVMLIGVDPGRDPGRVHAAYNDVQGITAAFNLNLLRRVNRELGATFDLRHFAHRAFYDRALGRVEMHLESLRDQTVVVDGEPVHLRRGETVHTENSYKYSRQDFRTLAIEAGLRPRKCWTDSRGLFHLHLLEVP